jgi:hypothetical protein
MFVSLFQKLELNLILIYSKIILRLSLNHSTSALCFEIYLFALFILSNSKNEILDRLLKNCFNFLVILRLIHYPINQKDLLEIINLKKRQHSYLEINQKMIRYLNIFDEMFEL